MFNPRDEKMQKAGNDSPYVQPTVNVIGAGTTIDGEVACEGDLRVDGKVKGTISAKSKVSVGATGVVDGNIVCESADIAGKFFGKTEVSDMLMLKSTGYLEGDIVTGKLVVEAGARFTGSCKMGVKEIKPNEKISSAVLQKEAI